MRSADLMRLHPDLTLCFDLDAVPLLPCFWTAGEEIPAAVRHLYFSHSAFELVCFAHFHPGILKFFENIAFAALGARPMAQQVQELRRKYPRAKVHSVFGNDTIGKVCDCLLALWLKGRRGKFRIKDEMVEVTYKEHRFYFAEPIFSLHRFEKATGMRSGIHTHKPIAGFTSWAELFANTNSGL